MFRLVRVSALASLALFACQQREVPRDFKLELPDTIVSPDPVSVVVRLTRADGSAATSTDENDFVVKPEGLARVSKRGSLVCLDSGDGSVSLTLGSITRGAPLYCRLVERVDTSNLGRVELAQGAFKPNARVLGKGGVALDRVEITYSSKNTGVVQAHGAEVLPLTVGNATILARAGQVTSEFKVDVVRKLTPEALPIDQNRKIHFSLEPGKYELTVALPGEKRLSAEWRGAPYCNYAGVSRTHVSTCVLRTKGGVDFDSPAYLMTGSQDVKDVSVNGVAILEVP